jgi:ATP-dependent DNA ligase
LLATCSASDDAWAQVLKAGYEGLVGKDNASPYVGGRTPKWLKVKVPKHRGRARMGGEEVVYTATVLV